MRDAVGITVYVGNKAIHKLAEWIGILLYVFWRIQEPIVIAIAFAYVIYVIIVGIDNINLIVGAAGALLMIPLSIYICTEKRHK